jgi:hypothetical protein
MAVGSDRLRDDRGRELEGQSVLMAPSFRRFLLALLRERRPLLAVYPVRRAVHLTS